MFLGCSKANVSSSSFLFCVCIFGGKKMEDRTEKGNVFIKANVSVKV